MRNGDLTRLHDLIQQLDLLRAEMLNLEADGLTGESDVHPGHRASARNLLHYLALRRHDIRDLQEQLAAMGLSSLGRTESHVISALHSVMDVSAQLTGTDGPVARRIERTVRAETGAEAPREKHRRAAGTRAGRAPRAHHGHHALGGRGELTNWFFDLVASGMNCGCIALIARTMGRRRGRE